MREGIRIMKVLKKAYYKTKAERIIHEQGSKEAERIKSKNKYLDRSDIIYMEE